jgi:hypothetical protein
MTTQFATLEKEITDALWSVGRDVESLSRGRWRWHVDGSGKASVDVRLEDEWLTCQLPVPSPSSEEELWRAVERSASLDGVCKIIIEPRDDTFHIRQDVPVTGNGEFANACRRALEAVASTRQKHLQVDSREKTAAGDVVIIGTEPADRGERGTMTMKEACIEAGWKWSEREGGEPFVDIEVPEGSRKVGVETFPGKGCRLLNAFVRFARAGVEEKGNGVEVFYEAWIDGRPAPAVVGHALASLSVGCRLCERELQVLGDENVARMFLELRGSFLDIESRSPRKRPPARQG